MHVLLESTMNLSELLELIGTNICLFDSPFVVILNLRGQDVGHVTVVRVTTIYCLSFHTLVCRGFVTLIVQDADCFLQSIVETTCSKTCLNSGKLPEPRSHYVLLC